MEAGTEALPRGITHHPDVLRRYFYERVFHYAWGGPIWGPEGDNMTKHDGRFVSLKALRDRVLKDIEDLIAFMTVPVGESTRSAMYRRTPEAKATAEGKAFGGPSAVAEPFVPHYLPGINPRGYRYSVREEKQPATYSSPSEAHWNQPSTKEPSGTKPADQNILLGQNRSPSSPSYLPFSEKLKSIEARQPFLEQVQRVEDRAHESSAKNSLGDDTSQQSKVKDKSLDHVTSETSTLQNQHVSSPYTTSNPHRSSSKGNRSLPHKSPASSNTGKMEAHGLTEILRQNMSQEDRQALLDANVPRNEQHNFDAFGYQLPPQRQQYPPGGVPTGTFSLHRPHDSWTSPPPLPMYQQYGYPHPSGGPHQSHYVAPSTMQYPCGLIPPGFMPPDYVYTPLSHGPPPPSKGRQNSLQYPMHAQQATARPYEYPPLEWGPPPPGPYAKVAVRPPSDNRVAGYVYRNDPTFQHNSLPQVRGTPGPLQAPGRATPPAPVQTQQYEWQNRFGFVPVVKPKIPVLPYRPGSDDMRPHATPGAPSVPYQELTRNAVPTFDEARAPENMPFAEVAKESKPPSWGVLKIGNVSTQSKDKDPAKRILKRPGRP